MKLPSSTPNLPTAMAYVMTSKIAKIILQSDRVDIWGQLLLSPDHSRRWNVLLSRRNGKNNINPPCIYYYVNCVMFQMTGIALGNSAKNNNGSDSVVVIRPASNILDAIRRMPHNCCEKCRRGERDGKFWRDLLIKCAMCKNTPGCNWILANLQIPRQALLVCCDNLDDFGFGDEIYTSSIRNRINELPE